MTLCRPGVHACVLLVAGLLAAPGAQAACSDKTLRAMADAGRSVSTMSKRCGMSVTAVTARLEAGGAKTGAAKTSDNKGGNSKGGDNKGGAGKTADSKANNKAADSNAAEGKTSDARTGRAAAAPPSSPSPADASSRPTAKAAAEPQKYPPGTVLELCGCYGSMAYGFTEANAECLSGKAVATRCPGYCPVNRSPWRRICS